jgi:hypothetical protein
MRRVLLIALLCPCLQSQPPSPAPLKGSQTNQRKTGTITSKAPDDQQISEKLAAAIDKLASEIAARKKQETSSPDETNPPPERWLIVSAIVSALAAVTIAVLSYFQFRATHRQAAYMERGLAMSDKAATAAADSAKIARDTLVITQRADLKISSVNWNSKGLFDSAAVVTLTITNYGNTQATAVLPRLSYGVFSRPETVDYVNSIPTDVGAGDAIHAVFRPIGDTLGSEVLNEVLAGKSLFEFRGTINYTDVFRIARRNKCQGHLIAKTLEFAITQRDAEPE